MRHQTTNLLRLVSRIRAQTTIITHQTATQKIHLKILKDAIRTQAKPRKANLKLNQSKKLPQQSDLQTSPSICRLWSWCTILHANLSNRQISEFLWPALRGSGEITRSQMCEGSKSWSIGCACSLTSNFSSSTQSTFTFLYWLIQTEKPWSEILMSSKKCWTRKKRTGKIIIAKPPIEVKSRRKLLTSICKRRMIWSFARCKN